MAQAMNAIGYDAVALGNHEFNYGIETLRKFESQCRFPLLGANALDARTQKPAFPPYFMKKFHVPGAPPVKVAVLGLTNPGIAIWDKAYVQGKLTFPGLEEQAAKWVPKLRSMGADVVVVSAHSGTSGTSSYGDQLPYVEDAAANVARQVPGIDAILVGHAHQEIPELKVTNERTGRTVVLSEPLCFAERLTLFDIALVFEKGKGRSSRFRVACGTQHGRRRPEDHEAARRRAHEGRRVRQPGRRQGDRDVDDGGGPLQGRPDHRPDQQGPGGRGQGGARGHGVRRPAGDLAGVAVLAHLADPGRQCDDPGPVGPVRVRQHAGRQVMTGAQVRAYLEYSAEYFVQTAAGAPVDVEKLTNANGRPDYNYDYVSGLQYEIDIAQAAGSRIKNVTYGGAALDDAQQFVFAVNNYRANGGGAFPHVASAKELWSESTEIRTRIAEWATTKGVLDPKDFASADWRLTRDGVPLF